MKAFYLIIFVLIIACKDHEYMDPKKATVVKKNGIEIPVYDFENFEYLISKDDGKTRIINFWATWCRPCISELPYFEMINSRYLKNNVEVILVNLDIPSQIESRVIPFLKKQELRSKIIVLDDPDANKWIPKIDSDWSGAIPATLMYKGGNQKFFEQSFTYNELEREVKDML